MTVIFTQLLYLTVSAAMTIYVGHSLHKQGRIFLVRTFDGDEPLADSVNHLLVVGFYLVNLGCVFLWTRYGETPTNGEEAIVFVTTKVGAVLLFLGCFHLVNVRIFWILGRGTGGAKPIAHVAGQ